MLCPWREMTLSRSPASATQLARWHHLTQPWQHHAQKSTQHDTSKVLRLSRKMTMEVSKVLRRPRKMQVLLKTLQKYCTCHAKRPLTLFQTRENVTKCHACHAKRHYNIYLQPVLRPSKMRGFADFPIDTATSQTNRRMVTRHVGASKRTFPARPPQMFTHLIATQSTFSYEFCHEPQELLYIKIDVSCEASVNFHHISQNATPAMEFARCHHLTQPWQCNSHKTQQAMSEVLRVPCKMTMKVSKVLPLPRNMQLIFWKGRKIIALVSYKTILDMLWNMLERHEVPRLPQETMPRDVWNLQKWPLLQNSPDARPCCCERLRTHFSVERPRLNPQTPKAKREPFATHSGNIRSWWRAGADAFELPLRKFINTSSTSYYACRTETLQLLKRVVRCWMRRKKRWIYWMSSSSSPWVPLPALHHVLPDSKDVGLGDHKWHLSKPTRSLWFNTPARISR